MSVAVLGRDWDMIPSSSSHEQQQQQQPGAAAATTTQQQQQEKKASQLFAQRALQERRLKPPDQVIACPRCQSLNTKFCYYNNYSLTQPRHFCKSCRRYWTAGGTLRNVPVGGGCRKNKRSKPRTPESSSSGPGSDLPPSASTLSVPSPPNPTFSSSVNFLSSSEGTPPFDPQQPQPQQLIPFPPGHPHPFDSNIAQLNFFRNHSRPEPPSNLHPGFQMPGPGDLSDIFDTSTVARVGALTTLNEGLGTFNLESHGRDPSQFVSLERWKQQQQQQQQQHQQQMRDGEGMDLSDVKGKMTLSMGPGGQRGWQPAQEANPALQHYQQQQQQQQQQTTPEQNYWANPGWPSMDSQAFQSSGGGQAL